MAIPAERCDKLIAFCKRMGCTILDEDAWRAGDAEMFAIQFGDHKINVHPPALWSRRDFTLRAPAARPGCGDFCFVWDGDEVSLNAALHYAEVKVEVGPVRREGGRGGGRATGTSIYTRDPDGNLLEFIIYR